MRKGYTLRLYPFFDLDLLLIAQDPDTHFSSICKKALRAYINGEEYSIERIIPTADSGSGLCAEKRSMNICIKFDSYKDKDILDFLDTVNKGYKNQFIKNLLRVYMGGIDLSIFFLKGEQKPVILSEKKADKVLEKREIIQENSTKEVPETIPTECEKLETDKSQNNNAEIKTNHETGMENEKYEPEIIKSDMSNLNETENTESQQNNDIPDNMFDSFLENTALY